MKRVRDDMGLTNVQLMVPFVRTLGQAEKVVNLLGKTAPNFTTSTTWTQSGLTYTNGDLVVAYVVPTGVTDTDSRVGQQVTVRATYHQDLIIPLIAQLLPRDAGGRLGMGSEVTMVVN